MPKITEKKYPLTVYELNNSVTLKEYRRVLREKINAQKQKQIKDSGIKSPDNGTDIYFFSYTNNVDPQDITWHKTWQSIFNIDEPLVRNSRTGHGIIIVHIKTLEKKFALIFGRSFSLLKEYYIRDFGISLATRLFDSNTVEVVSSKYFSMIKNKQIIDYKDEYSLQADEGQAVDFLQARITEDYERRIDPNTQIINQFLNKVKPDASAGYSFIKVILYGNRITLSLIIEMLTDLANIQRYRERFELPVMRPVSKVFSGSLDSILLQQIKSEEKDFFLSVPFFGYDDSNRFVFFDEVEAFKLTYNEVSQDYTGKLDAEEIREFILENHDYIHSIRELLVSVTIAGEQSSNECLLRWVDADLFVDSINYALYDGEWVEFNQVYLDCLQRNVVKYEAECFVAKPELSFSNEEVVYYREHYPNELIDRFYSDEQGTIEGVYKEFVYNFALSQKKNWQLFDRRFGGQIEICDIYIKNEQYVHVKIGNSTGLDEVFRQSMLGLRFAEQNRHMWNKFMDYDGEAISDAGICSVIFLSANSTGEIPSMADNKSLRCKMTFIDWVTFMKERRKTPRLYVGLFTSQVQPQHVLHENLENLILN